MLWRDQVSCGETRLAVERLYYAVERLYYAVERPG